MAESEGGGNSSLLDDLPTDRLRSAAQSLLKSLTDKAVGAALEQVEGLTGRLTDVTENGGVGLSSALAGGREAAEGGNPVTGAIKGGLSAVKDKAMGAIGLGGGDGDDDGGSGGGSGGGGRGKFKFMNIVEHTDVGVPLRIAYDQWTQFADFPTFMKKVLNVDQEADEKTNWQAQVFWSKRTWSATIIEQVPDSHILWKSQGAKGYANGIVTFTELGPNLTRVLLVMEYYPVGLFEKTGNLWRAVGRRARLEFKHYNRHVMVETLLNQEELEGWRGEIRDSEVVKTHEEALEEERAAAEEDDEYDDYDSDEYDDEYEDEDVDDELPDEDVDDEAEPEDEAAEAEDYEEDAELEDVDEDVADEDVEDVEDGAEEDEGRPAGRRRARQPSRT